MGQIIVGVDGSDGATSALRWAADEASIRGSDLLAVLAWGHLHQHSGSASDADRRDADASAALDAMVTAALGPEVARRVHRRAVRDRAVPALLDAARDGDLLVVGARGMGGFRGLLLGSVSQQCVHHATAPTVVVRDVPPQVTGKVVVGIDGSPQAEAALLWALAEARLRHASLTVVHAYPPVVPGGPFSAARIDRPRLEAAAKRAVDAAVSGIDRTAVDVTPLAVCGSAAGAVIQAGEHADLVVVGSRGLGASKRLLLGSVATQVMHHARFPVAIVPTSEE